MNRIAPALLPLTVLLALGGCGETPVDHVQDPGVTPCPNVYRVLGGAAPAAFNLVFLPDGFREDEANSYRCAVQTLVDGLMKLDLYRDLACHINVYRIDPAPGGDEGIPPADDCRVNCKEVRAQQYPGGECPREAPLGTLESPSVAPGCPTRRLNVRLCSQQNRCDVVWLGAEGQRSAKCLADCAPAYDAVIIVANSGSRGGGAMADSDPPLAVVTLYQINDPSASELLAHETAHALFGLLDEYECYYDEQSYRGGLNVASAAERRDRSFIWSGECGDSCPVSCNDPSEPCAAGGISGSGPLCCKDAPATAGNRPLGLIEGAFYHRCGYYRAQDTCRMRTASAPFCKACRMVVDALEGELSLGPCASPEQTAPVN